jgi:hypothetical protein
MHGFAAGDVPFSRKDKFMQHLYFSLFSWSHVCSNNRFLTMQRVDAIEAILLVQRLDGSSPEEMATASKLQKLCILYDDNGLKVHIKSGHILFEELI